jgi:hypothetical protein
MVKLSEVNEQVHTMPPTAPLQLFVVAIAFILISDVVLACRGGFGSAHRV